MGMTLPPRINPARRTLLKCAAAAVSLSVGSRLGWASSYPSQPVRVIVGFPAGSSGDIVARLISQWLGERLRQPFVVEDRPGAGSEVATEFVIRSAADGNTLLWTTPANAIGDSFYSDLKFNFIRDSTPVAGVMTTPCVLVVSPNFPAKTVPELIAYAKANPRKINMASGGNGGTPHLAGELFKMMAGVDLTHVPYRGDSPAMTDLIGGEVDVMFGIASLSLEYIRSGQVRALAVTTPTRWAMLPDLPSVSEFVPGYEVLLWHGVSAPKNTPADVVDTLNKAINAGLADAGLKARLANLGADPMPMTPVEFGKFVADETDKWGKVVRLAGVKAN
jgi:tripartite-type tricarboxylate transporter receptor subunit TctC